MRAQEFITENVAISLSKLGKFHPGADPLAEFVPERATAQYALHPDKWESTFYSLTNKDSDKLKYYGPKKISIPPGTLVGDMAIANKFYRSKTAEEKQQYAESYRQSLKPYPVDVSEYRMPELLIPQQGVAEGQDDNGISFQVQKGKNKFATTLSIGNKPVGVYQYDADTGRSIAEVYPEFKGKGLGKLLVLHAIYTAAQLGLDFQEDESRTAEYDNVLDSLSSNGYIVDDDGYWYVTGEGEQYLQQSMKQGVAEAFNQPYSADLSDESEHGDYDSLTQLPDGSYLTVMFNNQGDDEYQVEFWRGPSQGVTGEGDAQRIFATVLNTIQRFIKEHNPWRLTFSATKDVEPGQNSESRAKLYNRLVDRYAAAWGYDALINDLGDQVEYELTRLKPNLAEGLTEIENLPARNFDGKRMLRLRIPAKRNLQPLLGGTDLLYAVDQAPGGDPRVVIVEPGVRAITKPQIVAVLQLEPVNYLPNTVQVGFITVDEDYRGRGLAKALYGIVFTKMRKNLLSGDTQTPGGKRNWISLVNMPGVQVKGLVQISNDIFDFNKNQVSSNYQKYIDQTIDQIMELGGQFFHKNKDFSFWLFDVVPGKGQLQPYVQNSLSKLYGYDARNLLLATWNRGTNESQQGVAENFADGRKFVEPNFDFEWEEAERYPEFVKLGKDAWIELAKKGKAVTINSAQGINNTDAADPDSFKSLVPAKQKRALAQLEKGTVEMPIVAVYSDGHKELIGGNTRLTAMMARDGKATVWAFRVPSKQGVAEGKHPNQQVVNAIQKVLPVAQEIWFHGSRATGQHRRNSDTDILVVVPDDLVGDQYLGVVRILQKLSSHFDNYDIQPTKSGTNIHQIAQEEGKLLWSTTNENFADGKVKGKSRPGRVKRSGASCNGSVTDLRQRAKNASGERAKMYHWCANMKSGKKK